MSSVHRLQQSGNLVQGPTVQVPTVCMCIRQGSVCVGQARG